MVMASHQAFKTHTDPPVNPVKHPLSCTHQPSPSATPPGACPRRRDSPTSSPTRQTHRSTIHGQAPVGRHHSCCPSPAGCQYFLDPAEAVDQSGDVGLGGAPLGWFQGQHQLPAGFEPAAVHLTDVITVLQPHRVQARSLRRGPRQRDCESMTRPPSMIVARPSKRRSAVGLILVSRLTPKFTSNSMTRTRLPLRHAIQQSPTHSRARISDACAAATD